MGAEILVSGIKDRQLECIDDAAHGINDSSGKKPQESAFGKRVPECAEDAQTYPAHGNIDNGRKPLRAGDPAGFDDHAGDGDAPYHGQQGVAETAA